MRQCNPPERVAREIVELPPMQAFIQHLLYDVLMKRTQDKVLRLMRKMHWEDQETADFILKTFTEVWEVKYENIGRIAGLVYDLQRYHIDFSVAVVDQVMEDIRIGMEVGSPILKLLTTRRRTFSSSTSAVSPVSSSLLSCTCTASSTRPSSLRSSGP